MEENLAHFFGYLFLGPIWMLGADTGGFDFSGGPVKLLGEF